MPAALATDRSITRAIAFLAVAGFASQSMVRVTDSLLPQIAGDFGITVGAAAIAVWAYALAHGSIQLIIGPVGDRFGKYACVAMATAAAAVLVALCGLAQSLPALVTARLAVGFAAGWVIPLGMAFLGDVVPYESRQRVLGRFLSGQIMGQLFGQAAGGVLGDWFGWRNVFFVLAALFALASAALWLEYARNPITRAGHALATRSRGFVMDNKTVLRSSWARTVILFAFLENGMMFGAFAYVGAYLHLRFDLSIAFVGLLVGAFAVGGLLYAAAVGALIPRLGQIKFAAGGGILLAIGFGTLAMTPFWQTTPLSVVVIGFGFYMLHNTLQTNITQATPEARGTALGIFSAAIYFGQMLFVSIGAWLFDHYSGQAVFVVAGTLLLATGLVYARILAARSEV
ncbi:MAG: MFS transporter [Pseudolabrys sp.]|nr:MFS transporter [Pseudolabrys sp.]MBV9955865.1 MFS transporter [Pseudolabrys sp.]